MTRRADGDLLPFETTHAERLLPGEPAPARPECAPALIPWWRSELRVWSGVHKLALMGTVMVPVTVLWGKELTVCSACRATQERLALHCHGFRSHSYRTT